ncbi:hypothetical protein M3G91_16980 [Micromonospora chalcea]|uniref:hypothetical protein n=1 Tax=Micromonospora chalcea TaxID=1874 RepID=UPI0021A82F5C|nr:hypothetical protein [Micromonospora chalcea]MCT2279311.1 hypothetical protein [Micromonospora chalcea]
MAEGYFRFGGDIAGYVVAVGANDTVVFAPGAELLAWPSRAGGDPYPLLDDADGQIPFVTVSDGNNGYSRGGLPRFQAPAPAIWLGDGESPRVLALTTDLPDMVAQALLVAAGAQSSVNSHASSRNAHETGLADLTDTTLPPPEQRLPGQMLGTLPGGSFGLLTPSQASGAVILNPRNAQGQYVGQMIPPPDPSAGQNGPSWFRMQATYSPDDNLPDMFQLGSTTQGGAWILTGRYNGNGEGRDSPSDRDRVARRVFEMLQSLGGPSRKTFFELSTNPTNPADREKLFAAYGTGHASMPGWMVATRVLAGQKGVQAGGNHNALTSATLRGRSAGTGAPTAGVWVAGDVVLDAAGSWWLCTETGEPGTWVGGSGGGGSAAPTALVDVVLGPGMAHGAKRCRTRLEHGGAVGRLRGTLTATGAVASGAVLATVTADHRPESPVTCIARSSTGGNKLTIAPNGEITYAAAFTSGQELWLDAITYDLEP